MKLKLIINLVPLTKTSLNPKVKLIYDGTKTSRLKPRPEDKPQEA